MKPHFSYWIVAALGLAWNLIGCLSFMVQTDPEAVARLPEVMREVIAARPGWVTATFGLSVYAGAAGAALLLLRRRFAVPVLIIALIATAVTGLVTIATVGPQPGVAMGIGVAAAMAWFAHTSARRDILV